MERNFFSWIREGVRRAVLLGVSDAVETIGEPIEDSSLRDQLALAVESGAADAALADKRGTRGGRKRLGRSLKDVEPAGKKDSSTAS